MIIPEAHACGRPVIALAKGGALETVIPELNGLFFDEETVDSLDSAVNQFEAMESRFYPVEIRSSGEQFSEERFSREMIQFVSENFEEHRLRFRSTIQTSNLSIQN